MAQQITSGKNKKRPFIITRLFNAPREIVWKAWTQPEGVRHWWGPKNFTAPTIKIDLRVGGKYLYCMRAPDEKNYWSTGTFKQIIPNNRLVLTDSFANEKGEIVPATYYGMSPDFPIESTYSVLFEDEHGKTKLTMENDNVSAFPESELINMEQGWNESLNKLAEYIEKKAVLNLGSIMIGSEQPKILSEFYEKVLGSSPGFTEENWFGWQLKNAFFMIGSHSEVHGKAKEPARIILNFETPEVKREFERIRQLGAVVVKEPYEMVGSWISTFGDPDGNYFQLMSPQETEK
jgi:uncharacterized protein YndB with AHSA1/START domain/predicted enzyme related to lactoylglutathione lyase